MRERRNYDQEFVNCDPGTLCELASVCSTRNFDANVFQQASYYLEIKPLVDITCQAIAKIIKGKSPEEVRSTFNIANDFEPEEEAQIAAQTAQFRFAAAGRRGHWLLRHAFSRAKKKESDATSKLSDEPETRPIEDLLSFINSGEDGSASKAKKTKKKKDPKKKKTKKGKKQQKKDSKDSDSGSEQGTANGKC